jgi:hypothetical protein
MSCIDQTMHGNLIRVTFPADSCEAMITFNPSLLLSKNFPVLFTTGNAATTRMFLDSENF